ncbi:D-aspartate oxidase-like [Pecten maximus]|uniref:D-aspartate oxidase-like n=1 Tax=Pecten maximus TaxID=6579 RepID=UPI001458573B|nr:D-aspartate oxidase-like [Pecten maximus]
MVTIIVIGAGVVGLSSAVSIQRALPGVKVKVVADRFHDETTSIGAGGIFVPTTTNVPGVPIEILKRWCETSWSAYSQMATSDLASTTGQTVSHGYLLLRTKMTEAPLYASMVYSFREMWPEELTRLGVYENFRFGYEITTIITNMRKYLTWLMTQFTKNGGEVEKRKIGSLSELFGQCDIVVNCSGLGSQELCGDKLLHPVRGQLIKVKAPWVRDWVYTDAMAQIFPSDDFTVIGGVKDKDNRSMTPDPSVRQGILDRCLRFWPALKGAEIIGDWVGLRPMRVPVRLEKEALRLPEGILNVVHNYGHGSNGVALSWGTAVEATEMVKDLVSKIPPSKL